MIFESLKDIKFNFIKNEVFLYIVVGWCESPIPKLFIWTKKVVFVNMHGFKKCLLSIKLANCYAILINYVSSFIAMYILLQGMVHTFEKLLNCYVNTILINYVNSFHVMNITLQVMHTF